MTRSKSEPDFARHVPSIGPAIPCFGCCSDPVGAIRRLVARTRRTGRRAGTQTAPGGRAPDFEFSDPRSALIIFDWDDTLLPTTFVMGHVDEHMSLPEDFTDADALTAHAHLVGFVLRTARRIARVAIVTNSMDPWVLASGQRYLPGLDIGALLKELDIPVYYARRHLATIHREKKGERTFDVEIDRRLGGRIGVDIVHCQGGSLQISSVEDSGMMAAWNTAHHAGEQQVRPGDRIVEVNGSRHEMKERCRRQELLRMTIVRDLFEPDPFVEAKRIDMDACLKKFYPHDFWYRNVVSIGDSVAEQQALKQVLHQSSEEQCGTPVEPPGRRPLCKTINLLDKPTLEQLSSELRLLMVWLGHVVDYDKDFDLRMDGLDSLEKKLMKT